MACAKLPQNISKNRYRDISPCEYHCILIVVSQLGRQCLPPFFLSCILQTTPHVSYWKARMIISTQITSMYDFSLSLFKIIYRCNIVEFNDFLYLWLIFQMEIPASCIINRYIACQGPLPNTCTDFWQMTWEQGSSMVVMLTTQVERGRVSYSEKCYQFIYTNYLFIY